MSITEMSCSALCGYQVLQLKVKSIRLALMSWFLLLEPPTDPREKVCLLPFMVFAFNNISKALIL